jgi:hypothetical protein
MCHVEHLDDAAGRTLEGREAGVPLRLSVPSSGCEEFLYTIKASLRAASNPYERVLPAAQILKGLYATKRGEALAVARFGESAT